MFRPGRVAERSVTAAARADTPEACPELVTDAIVLDSESGDTAACTTQAPLNVGDAAPSLGDSGVIVGEAGATQQLDPGLSAAAGSCTAAAARCSTGWAGAGERHGPGVRAPCTASVACAGATIGDPGGITRGVLQREDDVALGTADEAELPPDGLGTRGLGSVSAPPAASEGGVMDGLLGGMTTGDATPAGCSAMELRGLRPCSSARTAANGMPGVPYPVRGLKHCPAESTAIQEDETGRP
mmetsp:Transcript_3844/g.11243  ORF Transcript_3844/g.11243 Transcript_3844/m.11243 type:complete len:242 (-) Transcript_3844:274-999(-)